MGLDEAGEGSSRQVWAAVWSLENSDFMPWKWEPSESFGKGGGMSSFVFEVTTLLAVRRQEGRVGSHACPLEGARDPWRGNTHAGVARQPPGGSFFLSWQYVGHTCVHAWVQERLRWGKLGAVRERRELGPQMLAAAVSLSRGL